METKKELIIEIETVTNTPVEWLEEQTRKPEWHSLKRQDIFEKAKEMEKDMFIGMYLTIKFKRCKLEYGLAYMQKRDKLEAEAEKLYKEIYK